MRRRRRSRGRRGRKSEGEILHPSKMAFEIPDSLHAEACSPTSTTAAAQTDREGRRNPDIGSPTPTTKLETFTLLFTL